MEEVDLSVRINNKIYSKTIAIKTMTSIKCFKFKIVLLIFLDILMFVVGQKEYDD